MIFRTYSELILLPSFKERFRYLKLDGVVGNETFGYERWLNQELYHSAEWKRFRDQILIRDNGCDLGVEGFEIRGAAIIHHLNPISFDDILHRNPCVFDPENAVCTQLRTHNAIHYGDERLLVITPTERTPNDTCPWKRNEGGRNI